VLQRVDNRFKLLDCAGVLLSVLELRHRLTRVMSSTHVEVLRLRVVGVLQPRLLRVDLRMEVPERARRVVDAERAAVLGGVEVGTATGFHLVRLDL